MYKTEVHRVMLFLAMALTGCVVEAPWGHAVNRNYRPEVLITYAAEGEQAPGVIDYLVREPKGLAIFEQDASGRGVVLNFRWRDFAGDHFAAWGGRFSPAFEIVVPTDSSRSAYRFVYDVGTYRIVNVDGIDRPVPLVLVEASAELLPAGRVFREPPPDRTLSGRGHQQ